MDFKKEETVASSSVRQWMAVGAVALAVCGAKAWADDAPAAAATPAPAPGVEVTGFVDGSYGYNFNKPNTKLNKLHTFDVDHNSFELNLAEVAFEKKVAPGSAAGFRIDLDFGPVAGIVGSVEPSSNKDVLKHIEQGYVSWLSSPKVQWDFGKFVTPIGAEVIESKDNWNYTRSIQFGFAIPFYHTGLRATVNPSDKVSLAGYVVNGWNSVTDNNNDKSFIGSLTLKPSAKFTWVNNGMVGKEVADNTRFLYDTVMTLTPSDKASFMANFDYGKDGDQKWYAISGYAKFVASPKLTFSPRAEWLNDDDAFMTGTPQKLTSFTLTTEFKLGGDLLTRLDLRYDHSSVLFFDGEGTGELKQGQTTATVGVVYAFGGKI
jgi:Putative beta-barrel porin-2, OmpL-like. bbp2